MANYIGRTAMGTRAGGRKARNNSFYRYGDDVLIMEQDERTGLWKLKLTAAGHYVVSRKFDRSVGMYANAPDSAVMRALMDFSDMLEGDEMSVFDVMDKFIDRCFSDSAFDRYTTNALWLCIDQPRYEQVEEALNGYSARFVWPSGDFDEPMRRLLMRYEPSSPSAAEHRRSLKDFIERNGVTAVFVGDDPKMRSLMSEAEFAETPCFVSKSGKDMEFCGFEYLRRE